MKKIVLFSLVGLLILLFSGCGLMPFTTPGVEQPSIGEPPEAPEGLEIGLDPAASLELAQLKGPTKHIPSDTSIGTWDPVNKIYTLTTDVNEGIVIDEDDLTLDGAGHTINGSYYCGVYLHQRSNVTVKNCVVSGFKIGINLSYSSSNILTDNTANNNYLGIYISYSPSNTLTSNIMSGNKYNFKLDGSQDSEYDNDIDISNTVDGKPIYYIRNAVKQVYDSSTNAGTFYCINCENVVLRDLTLTKNYTGVFFWKTSNSRIENITVSENDFGIWLNYSDSNTLTDNTANNNWWGIYLNFSSSNTLTDNTANNNDSYGILLSYNPNDNTLTSNTANNNGYSGISLNHNSSNTLTDNTASNNGYSGISLVSSSSNTLTDNTASNNWWGIYLSWSSSNTLTDNTASNNNFGISLDTCSSNKVYNNNFINNLTQVCNFGPSFYGPNEFSLDKPVGGNYWSVWTSPDDDCDGFVDYPYVFTIGQCIFTVGQDDLPWICQDGWKNIPPVTDAGSDKTVLIGETVQFDGSGSCDPDGIIVSYEWDFGDGTTDSGVLISHIYDVADIYTVTLTITDDDDLTGADTAEITVQTPAEATGDMITTVEDFELPKGVEKSLIALLKAAIKSLENHHEQAAIGQLTGFIRNVEEQNGKKLTEEQAQTLIAAAQRIIDSIQ